MARTRERAALLAAAGAIAVVVAVTPAAAMARCLLPPVDAPIVDHFRPPACPWCPGNRGLEYDVAPGTTVRAAAAGTVTFAGPVASVVYVVVQHADGQRATYGRLAATHLGRGDRVPAGAAIGSTGIGFFFGLRQGRDYVDPEPLLGRLVARPRLIPVDGTAARPAPPPRLRCRTE